MSYIDDRISNLQETIQKMDSQILWLQTHREKLESLELEFNFYGYLGFNYLTHQQVLEVIKKFGGKWEKTPNEGGINYSTIFDGINITCYQAEPPPNCKIIEVEEFVPESYLPSYKRMVKKIRMACI